MKDCNCSRCKKKLSDLWEDGWPNHGIINLGLAGQSFGALCGSKTIAEEEDFKVWSEGHQAMTEFGAQRIQFEWGLDNDSTDYILCYRCQKELFMAIGKFFGFPERAKSIKEAAS